MLKIIDTFQDFLIFIDKTKSKKPNQKIDEFKSSYMFKYPELFEKIIFEYKKHNINPFSLLEKYFDLLEFDYFLDYIKEARRKILNLSNKIYIKFINFFKMEFNVLFVIYFSIGFAAGWATKYENLLAVLFGLEKIGELKWHKEEKIEGLIAHELSHLIHMKIRDEFEVFDILEENQIFNIYSEGFAQRVSSIILNKLNFFIVDDVNDYIDWYNKNHQFLKEEYFLRIQKNISTSDFFGDWFKIKGKSFAGYFLGYEFIKYLESNLNLYEIATLKLEDIKILLDKYLLNLKNENLLDK